MPAVGSWFCGCDCIMCVMRATSENGSCTQRAVRTHPAALAVSTAHKCTHMQSLLCAAAWQWGQPGLDYASNHAPNMWAGFATVARRHRPPNLACIPVCLARMFSTIGVSWPPHHPSCYTTLPCSLLLLPGLLHLLCSRHLDAVCNCCPVALSCCTGWAPMCLRAPDAVSNDSRVTAAERINRQLGEALLGHPPAGMSPKLHGLQITEGHDASPTDLWTGNTSQLRAIREQAFTPQYKAPTHLLGLHKWAVARHRRAFRLVLVFVPQSFYRSDHGHSFAIVRVPLSQDRAADTQTVKSRARPVILELAGSACTHWPNTGPGLPATAIAQPHMVPDGSR